MNKPYCILNIEKVTNENRFYRRVLYTTSRTQLVLMSLKPGQEIGSEVHEDGDQFIRVETGKGLAILNNHEYNLEDGTAMMIPAGTQHNIINRSEKEDLQLYAIYSPPEHAFNHVDKDKP